MTSTEPRTGKGKSYHYIASKVKPDGTLLGIIQVGNLNIASLDTVVKTLVSSTPTFQSLCPSE